VSASSDLDVCTAAWWWSRGAGPLACTVALTMAVAAAGGGTPVILHDLDGAASRALPRVGRRRRRLRAALTTVAAAPADLERLV
jgi:hypothetical protein